jgi:integrase
LVGSVCGVRDIKTVTRADINVAVSALQVKKGEHRTIEGQVRFTDKAISSSTVNRYLASLSSVFNYALDTGLIERHPIKGGQVRKLEEGKGRTRILTIEEEDKLIAFHAAEEFTPKITLDFALKKANRHHQ